MLPRLCFFVCNVYSLLFKIWAGFTKRAARCVENHPAETRAGRAKCHDRWCRDRRQCCGAGMIKPAAGIPGAFALEDGSSATTDSGGKVNVTFRPALVMPPGNAPT